MRVLLFTTLFLSFIVIVLGAYVRLSDAGLGCPDWPGCYGRLTVPESVESSAVRPLESGKAWKEMTHRYFAGALGLLIFLIALLSWVQKRQRFLATLLLGLVIFQALLGMWTVTLLLHPLIVMGHLLGGFATLGVLTWMVLPGEKTSPLPTFVFFALLILLLQISLGGWTSANYAALSCPDFPTCQGEWWPSLDFKEAFDLGALGVNYEYGVRGNAGRMTIHLLHRLGAVVTFFLLMGVGLKSALKGAERSARFFGAGLAGLVILQFALGVSNVLMFRPLKPNLFVAIFRVHNDPPRALVLN